MCSTGGNIFLGFLAKHERELAKLPRASEAAIGIDIMSLAEGDHREESTAWNSLPEINRSCDWPVVANHSASFPFEQRRLRTSCALPPPQPYIRLQQTATPNEASIF